MVINKQFIKTYLPINQNDPNEYTVIRNDSTMVSPSFKAKELFNTKTGLTEHPISLTIIRIVQAVRDYFDIPIRIESANPIGRTYRNYPSSGANPSAHHLGQAIDFSFIANEEIQQELYLLCREDFKQKGRLFQRLWDLGCRGFGSYDTFIHLDSVIPELYDDFAKRKSTYQGKRYGKWDNMKELRYLSPSAYNLLPNNIIVDIKPLPGQAPSPIESGNSDLPVGIIPEKEIIEVVQETAYKALGSTIGFFSELMDRNVEDKYEDANEKNVGYMVATISFALLSLLTFFFVLKRIFR